MEITLKTIEGFRDKISRVDSTSNYWLVRANGGEFTTDFKLNNYIGINYNKITLDDIFTANFNTDMLKDKIKKEYSKEIENKKLGQPGKIAGQLSRFTHNIKINDIVVVPSESSNSFLVGKVIGEPYQVDEAFISNQIESSYKKSTFMKRIPIKWIKSFDRETADAKLYKMIYSQQTLSDINAYKAYINRALFDIYIEDETLHVTYNVTRKTDVSGKMLGQFVYCYATIYELLNAEDEMDIRINVQSPGPIESVSKNVVIGLSSCLIAAAILSAPYGGHVKIGNDIIGSVDIEVPGIIPGELDAESQSIENELKQKELDDKKLEQINKIMETAKELKVPVSELGIELPDNLSVYMQEAIDKEEQEVHNQKLQDTQQEERAEEQEAQGQELQDTQQEENVEEQ